MGSGGIMLGFESQHVDAEFARLHQELNLEFVIPPTTMARGNESI
jgi:hypothetical protein